MSKKRLEEIAREQDVIRARLEEIANLDEPEGDDVTRARILDERGTETDDLLAKDAELEEERKPLAARQARLEAVMARAQNPANRDGASEDRYLGGRGPEIKRGNLDPYDNLPAVKAGMVLPTDVIARAKTAVERAPDHMVDQAKEQVTQLLQLDNGQSPLIARHLLMTGSEEYHAQFREYVQTRYVGELLRTAMSLTDGNGGFNLVAAAAA